MKNSLLLTALIVALSFVSCKKDNANPAIPNTPRTDVPASLQGTWMNGNFSLIDYWSQDPEEYLGNGIELAFAFKFNADGTYEQYFTGKTVIGTVVTYHQSVTKGTVEINETTKAIITHPNSSHYKRTENGTTKEDRDMNMDELEDDSYTYETGTELNGTKALYMTLEDTDEPLKFLKQ
ncbi:hypothetical protein I5907_17140 [Panacibacter sp. DH6]|uniref:Lipocalin-like domain-containing protein n=1 Tax=Panacibacter microcysteis TaxID=2793269 RepID=A0A931GZ11_9BACT|nr:hypothetical protein [Panacibacter microcysteis]MBG9377967.1 hypothetical protein [Panacibacter microcysteis]